jgi:hypothetical protein
MSSRTGGGGSSFLRPCIRLNISPFQVVLLTAHFLRCESMLPNLLPIPLIQQIFHTRISQICHLGASVNAQYRTLTATVPLSASDHIDFYIQHRQTTAGVLESRNLNFSPPPVLRSICFGVPFTRQRPHSKGRPPQHKHVPTRR